jgi:probable rRNA maturation factor
LNEIDISFIGVDKITEKTLHDSIIEFCYNVLEYLNIDNWEVSVVFCNNPFIQALNEKYRKKNGPTDVLTFSQSWSAGSVGRVKAAGLAGTTLSMEPSMPSKKTETNVRNSYSFYLAGDIVISIDTARINAKTFHVSLKEELKRLLVHGLLHLNGMNHENEDDVMLKKQEEILKMMEKER